MIITKTPFRISFCGGGKLMPLADVSLHMPIDDMQITEDIHMVFDHLMMSVLYKRLDVEMNA